MDERWAVLLARVQAGVPARLRMLRDDVIRLRANGTLSDDERVRLAAQRLTAVMRPVLGELERALKATPEPETPPEFDFAERFLPRIAKAVDDLLNPTDPMQPDSAWKPFEQILEDLTSRIKRSALKLDDIAPALSALRESPVAVPGLLTGNGGGSVTVHSVESAVAVLSTKTRPKRIVIVWSDGKRSPFLLKGREDLVRTFLNRKCLFLPS